MKLLTEVADFDQIENKIFINEETKEKEYWVSGIFMQAEKVNKNKRFYPRNLMEREVNAYQEKIKNKSAMGELNHADKIEVNYERTTHLVKELNMKGNDVYGKAKILGTTIGKGIIMPLLDEGIKVGISSRALGSLKDSLDSDSDYKLVGDDFKFICPDIVSNPSAHDAYVSLMENKEWVIENGLLIEKEIDNIQTSLKNLKKDELKTGIVNLFEEFLNKIKK